MSQQPPKEVIDAIENGNTSITRRLDIYEADGTTLWLPGGENTSRLIDGTVSIDSGRDERRSTDLSLDNDDNALRPDANSGLWYDKILKPYRGVRYATDIRPPRVVIMEEDAPSVGYEMRAILSQLGYSRIDMQVNSSTFSDIDDYEILVSYMRKGKTTKTQLLTDAFNDGKKIITVGSRNDATSLPMLFDSLRPRTVGIPYTVPFNTVSPAPPVGSSGIPKTIPFVVGAVAADPAAGIPKTVPFTVGPTVELITEYGIYPPSRNTAVAGGWSDEVEGTYSGSRPTLLQPGVVIAALDKTSSFPMALIFENENGGRWFHYQPSSFGTQAKQLLANALKWLRNYQPYKNWEIQLGAFVIDSISQDHFPSITKITARDYTKKLLTNKMSQTLTFAKGTPAMALIQALAINAGIKSFNIPSSTETLPSEITVERGTDRWSIMKQVADTFSYEIFFDNTGALTLRKFIDPTFGALSWTYQTGSSGNLVSWTRTTNDSRLYNHIVVTGERESTDDAVELLPFFGEALNLEPSSPTRIDRIGQRSYFYSSTFFTSNQQCQDLALSWLKLKSLESYEMTWDSFNYPWQDVGEVVAFLDPERSEFEPTRFLMDTLSIPMGLGPMQATAKRITYVNDPNSVPSDDTDTG